MHAIYCCIIIYMKKLIIPIIILAIAAFAFVKFNTGAPRITPQTIDVSGTTSTQGASSSVASNEVAIVTPLSADVNVKTTTLAPFRTITEAASTTIGTVVKTSSSGRAIVEASFSHPTALDYSSELVIKDSRAEQKRTSIELTTGGLWARAKKLFEKGEFYEIKTSNAVAVVRGTSFGVTYKANKTTVIVTQGEVSAFNRDPKTGNAASSTQIVVLAGYKLEITGTSKGVLTRISSEDMRSDWYKYNTSADGTGASTGKGTSAAGSTSGTQSGTQGVSTTGTTAPAGSVPASGGSSVPTTVPGAGSTSYGGTGATSVKVSSVSPRSVMAGDSRTYVVVNGVGLKQIEEVSAGESVMIDLMVVNDNKLQFHVDPQLPVGTYDLILIASDGSDVTLNAALTVQYGSVR
ncbi:MAG: FecR protein [Candidatus Parcubacteria bacterium]|jgi:hypothetical protein